jgi:hypothetical protein
MLTTAQWNPVQPINGGDSTRNAVAACIFDDLVQVFWRANDPSDTIYHSAAANGATSFPPGQRINQTSRTINTPAACFWSSPQGEQILVTFMADDPSQTLHLTASATDVWPPDTQYAAADTTAHPPALVSNQNNVFSYWIQNGASPCNIYVAPLTNGGFPAGTPINATDTSPQAVSVVFFKGSYYMFWCASNGTNLVFCSSSADGIHWGKGWALMGNALTSSAPAACVCGDQLYLFVRNLDNTIQYFFTPDGVNWGGNIQVPGALTADAPAVCVYAGSNNVNTIYLFFKDANSSAIDFTSLTP